MADPRRIVYRYAAGAWNRPHDDRDDGLLAPDVVVHDPSSPQPVRGRDGHRQYVEAYRSAIPDLSLSVERVSQRGNHASVWATVRGTHRNWFMGVPGSGTDVAVRIPMVVRAVGDRVVEVWVPGWKPVAEVLEAGGHGRVAPERAWFDESIPWDQGIDGPGVTG